MKNERDQRSAPAVVAAQAVHIMGFVDGDVIPPACYDRPYRLEPEKDDSKAYDVLREVMHRTHKVGLAAVVIQKKQALAAVIPIGRTLVLNVLRMASGFKPARRSEGQAPTRLGEAAGEVNGSRRRAGIAEAARTAARNAANADNGAVIDLAVRRSAKRAHAARVARSARIRPAAVATLHPLRRKTPTEGQLA